MSKTKTRGQIVAESSVRRDGPTDLLMFFVSGRFIANERYTSETIQTWLASLIDRECAAAVKEYQVAWDKSERFVPINLAPDRFRHDLAKDILINLMRSASALTQSVSVKDMLGASIGLADEFIELLAKPKT